MARCRECRRQTGHKMDCGQRGSDEIPRVVKTVTEWAEHERVHPWDYFEEAAILEYPVESLTSPVPKHWHDDIKIKFREERRG